tara:strand:- start:238 stop:1014 length:777 start_codon:yes stop_codon:yes gene_type:complete
MLNTFDWIGHRLVQIPPNRFYFLAVGVSLAWCSAAGALGNYLAAVTDSSTTSFNIGFIVLLVSTIAGFIVDYEKGVWEGVSAFETALSGSRNKDARRKALDALLLYGRHVSPFHRRRDASIVKNKLDKNFRSKHLQRLLSAIPDDVDLDAVVAVLVKSGGIIPGVVVALMLVSIVAYVMFVLPYYAGAESNIDTGQFWILVCTSTAIVNIYLTIILYYAFPLAHDTSHIFRHQLAHAYRRAAPRPVGVNAFAYQQVDA